MEFQGVGPDILGTLAKEIHCQSCAVFERGLIACKIFLKIHEEGPLIKLNSAHRRLSWTGKYSLGACMETPRVNRCCADVGVRSHGGGADYEVGDQRTDHLSTSSRSLGPHHRLIYHHPITIPQSLVDEILHDAKSCSGSAGSAASSSSSSPTSSYMTIVDFMVSILLFNIAIAHHLKGISTSAPPIPSTPFGSNNKNKVNPKDNVYLVKAIQLYEKAYTHATSNMDVVDAGGMVYLLACLNNIGLIYCDVEGRRSKTARLFRQQLLSMLVLLLTTNMSAGGYGQGSLFSSASSSSTTTTAIQLNETLEFFWQFAMYPPLDDEHEKKIRPARAA
jgi:hypothetical protein